MFIFYLGLCPGTPANAGKYSFITVLLVDESGVKVKLSDATKSFKQWLNDNRAKLKSYFANDTIPGVSQILKKEKWNKDKTLMNWKKDKPNWSPKDYFEDAASYQYYRDYPENNKK